jgi:hypothetical protein
VRSLFCYDLVSDSSFHLVEAILERSEIYLGEFKILMLITKSFLLKYFCDIVNNLSWLVLIDLDLFLHETANFFPLLKLDILIIREVRDQALDADIE